MIKRLSPVLLAMALVLLLSGGLLMAKQGIVKTKDGRTIEGDVTELEEAVTISVHGVETTIPRNNIDSIQYVDSVAQQYQQRLAKLDKNDVAGHMALAKWLFENKQYELARNELDLVLRLDANSAEATTLYQTVQSQMRLERLHPGTVTPPVMPPPGPATTNVGKPAGNTPPERRFLSAEDINIIRQMEWPRDDDTVRIHLEGDVRKRFLNYSNQSAKDFQALTQSQQGLAILRDGLPEMRLDVHVLNDPLPLAEFRRNVESTVLSGCATANCHGATAAGKFFLFSPAETEAAAYTNLYILMRYRKLVDGAQRRMVDRTYPQKSLLVQYAMPADVAEMRHPEVPAGTAWHGTPGGFKNLQDVGSQKLIKWMGALVPIEPDYGINFSPEAATQPSTQPHNPIVPAPPHMPAPPMP